LIENDNPPGAGLDARDDLQPPSAQINLQRQQRKNGIQVVEEDELSLENNRQGLMR
jgi:hypothetical protein